MAITKEEQAVMQKYVKEHPEEVQAWVDEVLTDTIKDVHKFQVAHRSIVQEGIDNNLLPAYSSHFIEVNKQFCTLGVSGMLNSAQYLGYDISDANDDYIDWEGHIMGTFKKLNKEAKKKYKIKFNTEIVPFFQQYK